MTEERGLFVSDVLEGPGGNRYILEEVIGRGGMAEVFRAVQRGPSGRERPCVVKRIRADKKQSVALAQMFAHEAHITAALRHPAIVEVYDHGPSDGSYFIAMEYLAGRDVASVLAELAARQRRMPLSLAIYVAHQVAEGLSHAHALADEQGRPLGVVHRDISPANLMVLADGRVKVLDFGIAKATQLLMEGKTIPGRIKGTVAYMAPEQLEGRPVDARTDVFALGTVLWEMLTGEAPFDNLRAKPDETVAPPSRLRSDTPRRLDQVVVRALAYQPADRHHSAGALVGELGPFLRSLKFEQKNLARLMDDLFAVGRAARSQPSDNPSGGFTLVTGRPTDSEGTPAWAESTTRRVARAAREVGRRVSLALRRADPKDDLPTRIERRSQGPSPLHAAHFPSLTPRGSALPRRWWGVLAASVAVIVGLWLLAKQTDSHPRVLRPAPAPTARRPSSRPAVEPLVTPSPSPPPAPLPMPEPPAAAVEPPAVLPVDSPDRSLGDPQPVKQKGTRSRETKPRRPRSTTPAPEQRQGPLINPF